MQPVWVMAPCPTFAFLVIVGFLIYTNLNPIQVYLWFKSFIENAEKEIQNQNQAMLREKREAMKRKLDNK